MRLELIIGVASAEGVGFSIVEHTHHGLSKAFAHPGEELGISVVAIK